MLSYCSKCKKDRKHKFKSFKTSVSRTMLSSKCAICGSKKSRFIKVKKQVNY